MKMLTKIAAVSLAAGFVLNVTSVVYALDTKEQAMNDLKALLKNTPVMSFEPSPVPGLFEVATGDQIFFYSPKGVLFFGEMYDKDGNNLTAAKKAKLQADPKVVEYRKKRDAERVVLQAEMEKKQAEMIASLPLEKALKIGNGPIKVIEFTDPDCPFCRKAEKEALAGRTDITRYVFFFPLRQMHPDAAVKAAFIASQSESDRERVFNEVFAGQYDSKKVPQFSLAAQDLISEQEKIAQKLGVNGVPAFYINNTLVTGADIPKINQLLAQAGKGGK